MSPPSPFASKSGGHDPAPPAPMGAPPLAVLHHIRSVKIWNDFHCALFKLYFYFITANINKKQNQ